MPLFTPRGPSHTNYVDCACVPVNYSHKPASTRRSPCNAIDVHRLVFIAEGGELLPDQVRKLNARVVHKAGVGPHCVCYPPEGFKTRLVHAQQSRDIELVGLDRDRPDPYLLRVRRGNRESRVG